jgi:hypothetical protein
MSGAVEILTLINLFLMIVVLGRAAARSARCCSGCCHRGSKNMADPKQA